MTVQNAALALVGLALVGIVLAGWHKRGKRNESARLFGFCD